MQENTPKSLYDLLISKDFEVKILDAEGRAVDAPDEAEMFSFAFAPSKTNYGTVVILLNSSDEFEIFYGDNIGQTMRREDRQMWMDFLYQLRLFAKRNLMGFKLNDISKLKYSIKGQAAIKEGLFESYYGTRRTSYNPQGDAKIVIKHSRPLGETDKRYYNISSLFVESGEGERFKLPFRSLPGARAMARHVSEGGNPYDIFGNHIVQTVKEISALSGFLRRSKVYEEDEETSQYVMAGREYYQSLRDRLKKITGRRGYHMYRETWQPDEITQEERDIDHLRQLFTEKALNPRVEEALPVIAKLTTENNKMKEVSEFESWANDVAEGAWALPNSEEQIEKLRMFMAEPQPVGIDAMDASGKLYDVIGDNGLFDSLGELADNDAEADARPVVKHWLETNMPEVLDKIDVTHESLESELDADDEQHLHASANKILDKKLTEAGLDYYNLDQLSYELRKAIDDDLVSVYDLIGDTIGFKPGPEEMKILVAAYDEISHDKGLHPDDDYDDICNIMTDLISLSLDQKTEQKDPTDTITESDDLHLLLVRTARILNG